MSFLFELTRDYGKFETNGLSQSKKKKERDMSKDRNIDDAELAKISGAGDLEIAKAEDSSDSSGLTGKRPPAGGGGGGGNPGGIEGDADTGGDVEMGPA